MENQTNPTTAVRLFPICGGCARGEGSECHTPECAFFLRTVPFEALILEFAQDPVPVDTDDGQANDCRHDSASGIDTTPVSDPDKVWCCDHCGLRWTSQSGQQRDLADRYRLAWHVDAEVLCGAQLAETTFTWQCELPDWHGGPHWGRMTGTARFWDNPA